MSDGERKRRKIEEEKATPPLSYLAVNSEGSFKQGKKNCYNTSAELQFWKEKQVLVQKVERNQTS